MDTGCGFDLVSQRKAKGLEISIPKRESAEWFSWLQMESPRPGKWQSAMSTASVKKPNHSFRSRLLLSLMCEVGLHTFIWPPKWQPFMLNPSGKRITLHSKDDIPNLIPGHGSEPHDEELATEIHNLLQPEATLLPLGRGGRSGDDPGLPWMPTYSLTDIVTHETLQD